jgi:hypothetical protein
VRQERLRDCNQADHIDLELPSPGLDRQQFNRPHGGYAGVIHQTRQGLIADRRHGRIDRVRAGHVQQHGLQFPGLLHRSAAASEILRAFRASSISISS